MLSPAEEQAMPVTSESAREAASAALAAATERAKLLADVEEKEVQKLLGEAVTAQAELIELRLKSFTQMVQAVHEERASLQVLSPSLHSLLL